LAGFYGVLLLRKGRRGEEGKTEREEVGKKEREKRGEGQIGEEKAEEGR